MNLISKQYKMSSIFLLTQGFYIKKQHTSSALILLFKTTFLADSIPTLKRKVLIIAMVGLRQVNVLSINSELQQR